MKTSHSYGISVLGSLCVHACVLSVLLMSGDEETKSTVIQPQTINAKLVELAPKKKLVSKPKKPKKKNVSKTREKQRQLNLAKAKEDTAALKRTQAALELKEKERLDRLELERLERERLAEIQRQAEFAQTLADEQLSIDAQENEVEKNSYMDQIEQRLTDNWNRPPSARRGMETWVRLHLVPTGRVVGVTVLKSSGYSAFDRSVEQAAFKAGPFVELQQMSPDLFEKHFRQVTLIFNPEDVRL